MDETPELPTEVELVPVEPAGAPLPPPVTAKMLARDAGWDLAAALMSGAGLILLLAIVAGVGIGFTTGNFSAIQEYVGSVWVIAAMLIATQLPLLYFGLRRRRRNREKQRPLPALFDGDTGSAIRKGVSTGFAMTVLSMLYTAALQRLLGPDAVEQQLDFLADILDNKLAVAVLVLIIAGLAPVCEELFFRGVIFGSARAAGFSKLGAVISAVLFSFVHLSPLLSPFYATFAVAMCWLYARTGTLAAPIAAHMTLNSVACMALIVAGGNRV